MPDASGRSGWRVWGKRTAVQRIAEGWEGLPREGCAGEADEGQKGWEGLKSAVEYNRGYEKWRCRRMKSHEER